MADKDKLAGHIEHTNVKPTAITKDVEALCREAEEYGFASVCVNPSHVGLAVKLLDGSGIKVGTVIGFPLGATTGYAKARETENAVEAGAAELDMVLNIAALKEG